MADEFFETMLGEFLAESEEHLTSLNDNLLKLDEWVSSLGQQDSRRCDASLMNEMFRSAHSIKGLSAMMGLADINGLTHRIENVFDAARNDQLPLTSEIVEHVFQAVDRLRLMVDSLTNPTTPTVACDDIVHAISLTLREAGVEKDASQKADFESALAACHDAPSDSAASESDVSATTDLGPPSERADATTDETDPLAGIEDDYSAPSAYLEIFVDETGSALDALTDALVESNGPLESQAVNDLLVLAHRIKGCAASVGMLRAARLAHFMEDTLQALRDEQQPLMPELVTCLLGCVDGLRRYIDGIKIGKPHADDFGRLVLELQTCFAASRYGQEVSATTTAPVPPAETADFAALCERIAAEAPMGQHGIIGNVRFSSTQQLRGMKARLIYEKLSQIGELFFADPPESTAVEIDDLDRLTFGIVTDCDPETVRKLVHVSGVERLEISAFGKAAQEGPGPAASLTPPGTPPLAAPATAEATASEARASSTESTNSETAPKSGEGGAIEASKPAETIRVDIERLDELMNLVGQLVINKARFSQISESLKQLVARKQSATAINEVVATVRRLDNDLKLATQDMAPNPDLVRSQLRRIQSGLEGVQRDVARLTEVRAKANELLEAVHQLDRVSDSLQKSVMNTRMVPIGPLFNRFKRVIRDITRANGKEIRLEIHGEKTELDKRMIDELGDPLVHMIRNSADHGIESPAERQAAGKTPYGTVSLNAYHSGNCIVVQVKDDGGGLRPEKLLQKALGKGLISPAEAEKLSPQQIYQLIWEPGFSTASQITDISGRGMGMDIVRSAIEDLNGHVDLDSTPGVGTTFTIKLPLTLAILPSLLAEVDNDVFALPIESVVEIVSIPTRQFATVHGQLTVDVRNRVISVVDLFEAFDWNRPRGAERNEPGTTTLVIVSSEGRELAIIVDSLLGEQDVVIKSVSENYRNVSGIAGASILGDGRVSLILDVPSLVEMAATGR
ncbi:MAG: chemotaxis protein CheA [Pirellulales bacterium]|nr:chemotaxis protein CheA [Pirellulales bacterium]